MLDSHLITIRLILDFVIQEMRVYSVHSTSPLVPLAGPSSSLSLEFSLYLAIVSEHQFLQSFLFLIKPFLLPEIFCLFTIWQMRLFLPTQIKIRCMLHRNNTHPPVSTIPYAYGEHVQAYTIILIIFTLQQSFYVFHWITPVFSFFCLFVFWWWSCHNLANACPCKQHSGICG